MLVLIDYKKKNLVHASLLKVTSVNLQKKILICDMNSIFSKTSVIFDKNRKVSTISILTKNSKILIFSL